MCIIRLGILGDIRFYRTATIVELRTILRDTERRRIVLDDRFDADGPLTCVEWTLILRSLGWTPCVSLYFLTVTSFFPFEFLVICGTGFMEADNNSFFFFFFSVKLNFYHNPVNCISFRRNLKFGIVFGRVIMLKFRDTDISFREITWNSTTLQEVYAIFPRELNLFNAW